MSSAVLAAESVGKTYFLGQRSLTVLKGVDLELNTGEFIALQGASGSGKSTLLQLLGGLDLPTEGRILLNNEPLRLNTSDRAARFRGEHVGFVFQAYHLLPDLDALENVMLPAQVLRHPRDSSIRRARELLGQVGLTHRMDHRPNQLSGGEQQRVAIARALMNEPEIVLADEPTGNLDEKTGEVITEILLNLNQERDITVVLVTHNLELAARTEVQYRLGGGRLQDTIETNGATGH